LVVDHAVDFQKSIELCQIPPWEEANSPFSGDDRENALCGQRARWLDVTQLHTIIGRIVRMNIDCTPIWSRKLERIRIWFRRLTQQLVPSHMGIGSIASTFSGSCAKTGCCVRYKRAKCHTTKQAPLSAPIPIWRLAWEVVRPSNLGFPTSLHSAGSWIVYWQSSWMCSHGRSEVGI